MPDPLLLTGTDEPPAPREILAAGALTCVLEQGAIRELRWSGIEVLRGIAYLLRDRDWATPPATLSDLAIERHADRFAVSYTARIVADGATYTCRARIAGAADGSFSFAAEGSTDGPILTNRTGFVVLHAASFAGSALEVRHTDGTLERTRFPATISPGQPVLDIRSLRCAPAEGLDVACTLEAELPHDPAGKFEMEDQRNWSDASFKTYVGSLLDPWPYRIEPGRTLRQEVRVRIADAASARPRPASSRRALHVAGPTDQVLPAIGIAGPRAPLSEDSFLTLMALRPRWVVASIDLTEPDEANRQSVAAAEELCARCNAHLQLELVVPGVEPPAVEVARGAALCAFPGPEAVLVCPRPLLKSYQPSDEWPKLPPLADYYAAARTSFRRDIGRVAIGGGMVTYFTELNRCRPTGDIDFISHTTAPIIHAADDASVMQTLETLPHIARSVRALWPDLPYCIGPSSLAMRSNPYGAAPVPNAHLGRVALSDRDPRQAGLFAAAWTAGYAAALAAHGVAILSLHACDGPASVLAAGSEAWHAHVPHAVVRPVFHVQRALARADDATVVRVDGVPEGVALLAWQDKDGVAAIAANLGAAPRALALPSPWQVRLLDEASFAAAVRDAAWLDAPGARAATVELGAYATAFLHE